MKDFESNREYIKDVGGIVIFVGVLVYLIMNEFFYVDVISILFLLLFDDEDIKVLVVNWVIFLMIFLVFVFGSVSLDVKVSVVEVIYIVCGEGFMLKELVDDCFEVVKVFLNLLREDVILL